MDYHGHISFWKAAYWFLPDVFNDNLFEFFDKKYLGIHIHLKDTLRYTIGVEQQSALMKYQWWSK